MAKMALHDMSEFLTESEIRQVVRIYNATKNSGGTATQICKEVIEPNIDRINKTLRQENDPKYLAYVCEFMLSNK